MKADNTLFAASDRSSGRTTLSLSLRTVLDGHSPSAELALKESVILIEGKNCK